ncbi:hypothetical protein BIY37_05045 [Candidatus Brocadia sapporoensis]|uniref:Uncharacterized protein n=1 Tax=Candidatus Brocadia sapporoensis TaxID=392547 RepID=A0A1V6M123_9BACT|nr:hypothetical protein BIY37_05045 [Candidatus Brocadia sapporoensis]
MTRPKIFLEGRERVPSGKRGFRTCLIRAGALSFITGSTLMLLGFFKKRDSYKNFKDCIINAKR